MQCGSASIPNWSLFYRLTCQLYIYGSTHIRIVCHAGGVDPCAGVTCNYQGKCIPSDSNLLPLYSPNGDPSNPGAPAPPAGNSAPASPGGSAPGNLQPSPPPPTPNNAAYTCVCYAGYSGRDCEVVYCEYIQ